jgi:hypothetical protein
MKKKLFAFTPLDNCAASTSAFSGNVIKPVIIANKTLTRGLQEQLLVPLLVFRQF